MLVCVGVCVLDLGLVKLFEQVCCWCLSCYIEFASGSWGHSSMVCRSHRLVGGCLGCGKSVKKGCQKAVALFRSRISRTLAAMASGSMSNILGVKGCWLVSRLWSRMAARVSGVCALAFPAHFLARKRVHLLPGMSEP